MSKEAMKLALEALEAGEYYIDDLEAIVYASDDLGTHEDRAKMQAAITVLREELAKPDFWEGYVPEPIGAVGSSIKSESPLGCNGPTGPAQQEPVCAWQREDDDHMPGTWRSDCGVLWTFTDGSPVDNQMKYCCGCGAMLLEKNT